MSAASLAARNCTPNMGLQPASKARASTGAKAAAVNPSAWLQAYLDGSAAQRSRLDMRRLRDRLKPLILMDVVGALENAVPAATLPATIELYRHWIASQPVSCPTLYLAWFNLGAALTLTHDADSAVVAFQQSLICKPDFHLASCNLGTLLEGLGQTDAALLAWQRALQPDDARVLLLNNLARLLERQGRLAEAEQAMRRSLEADPLQPDVIQHWVHVRQKMCAWPVLRADIAGLSPQDLLRCAGPMATLALTDDVEAQCAAGADWIARKTYATPQSLSPAEGYLHDRVRIGYVSSDFCSHAMSYLIAELFERHDRTRFEVFGYCSSPDDGSDIRTRVVRSFDHFRIIRDVADEQAARQIRADEIDVLVDLNGLTSGARVQLLRWKPAPVQAAYLGFVGPVPLPELDYMFCDRVVVPACEAAHYRPAPLVIAPNYQANDSKRRIGVATERRSAGLPEDKFVFCCFSNHYKTTEAMFLGWLDILRRASNSVLWLVGDNEWARRNMADRAVKSGIDPARIVFAARVGPDEYMMRLQLADVFLDTFPYNAGTVASDAIRMGLPLVTLSGRSFASRMAASLLTTLGAERGITQSLQEYADFAVLLASDTAAFAAYQEHFTRQSWIKTIGNIAAFTASYEAAVSAIVKRPRAPPR